jgi:hypothetical protein
LKWSNQQVEGKGQCCDDVNFNCKFFEWLCMWAILTRIECYYKRSSVSVFLLVGAHNDVGIHRVTPAANINQVLVTKISDWRGISCSVWRLVTHWWGNKEPIGLCLTWVYECSCGMHN